jgi:hypothetical protein
MFQFELLTKRDWALVVVFTALALILGRCVLLGVSFRRPADQGAYANGKQIVHRDRVARARPKSASPSVRRKRGLFLKYWRHNPIQ